MFARSAVDVFAANGITVYIWPRLLPIPTVSFAVCELKAPAGVVIMASHNPSKYNGYMVYGPDGCQITTEVVKSIFSEIDKIDIYSDVKRIPFGNELACEIIRYIDDSVLDHYIDAVARYLKEAKL